MSFFVPKEIIQEIDSFNDILSHLAWKVTCKTYLGDCIYRPLNIEVKVHNFGDVITINGNIMRNKINLFDVSRYNKFIVSSYSSEAALSHIAANYRYVEEIFFQNGLMDVSDLNTGIKYLKDFRISRYSKYSRISRYSKYYRNF